MNVAAERRMLVAELRRRGKPGGDPFEQKYLGSPHPALGLSTPKYREVMAAFLKAHPGLTAKELNALAAAMWEGETIEEKWFGVGLLGRHADVLDDASWRLLDRFADESVGWGMCDGLGSGPIASVVYAKPARFREILGWTESENFWRRRIALYALNGFVRKEELDKPFVLIEKLVHDPEFWVQRAVGTWLRECWKVDRKRTEAFLRKHVKGMPRVVITVATERAPKAFREELRRKSKAAAKKV